MRKPRPAALVPLLLAGIALAHPDGTRAGQPGDASWLDRPLRSWNRGGAVDRARVIDEERSALADRCHQPVLQASPAERALTEAGWLAFHVGGGPLVSGDLEIVGGMTAADGMCRPLQYNLFVFVGGRFAGTLSPVLMDARADGASGAVRIAGGAIRVDFSRYRGDDPLCCPSAHVEVRYRVDRTAGAAVVVPVELRATRG
ncbi:MAG: LppP/LprE family lipoprotein [Vicinamibacterales bacterium]